MCANDLLMFLPGLLAATHTACLVAYKESMIKVSPVPATNDHAPTTPLYMCQWEEGKYTTKEEQAKAAAPADNGYRPTTAHAL